MNDWKALNNREIWDEATREIIDRRLEAAGPYRFFTPEEGKILEAFCDRLITREEKEERVDIAPRIDFELAGGVRRGYRLESMPWAPLMWQLGLAALERESAARFQRSFTELSASEQDDLIADIAAKKVTESLWEGLPPDGFFTEALKVAAKIYYAHPVSWDDIYYPGPAYPRGYYKLECGGREPWEPKSRE